MRPTRTTGRWAIRRRAPASWSSTAILPATWPGVRSFTSSAQSPAWMTFASPAATRARMPRSVRTSSTRTSGGLTSSVSRTRRTCDSSPHSGCCRASRNRTPYRSSSILLSVFRRPDSGRNSFALDLRHRNAERAQLLEGVHEFALQLDLLVLERERVQEVILVVSVRVAGEPDRAVPVAFDPEMIRVVGLEDLDVVPLPVRKAFQRPDRVLREPLAAADGDRRAGVVGPQSADAVLGEQLVPPEPVLPRGLHVALHRGAVFAAQLDRIGESAGRGGIRHGCPFEMNGRCTDNDAAVYRAGIAALGTSPSVADYAGARMGPSGPLRLDTAPIRH